MVQNLKHFIHLTLAQRPQSFGAYHIISPTVNSGNRLKKYVMHCQISIFEDNNDGENRCHFYVTFKSYMPFQRYELIYPPKGFRQVKSAVSLKWHVGFENGIKMTPFFTIILISK